MTNSVIIIQAFSEILQTQNLIEGDHEDASYFTIPKQKKEVSQQQPK